MSIFTRIKIRTKNYICKIRKWSYLKFPLGKKVYFIGTPEYKNLGDSAIAISQLLFLKKCEISKKRIKEFTQSEFLDDIDFISGHIGNKHLICGIGGGNIGNQWYDEELFRYSFLDKLKNNPTVIFPQTIYFTKDKDGESMLAESIPHYNNHKNLTIVAREEKSFELLNDLYPNTEKILTPDIVLSSNMEDYGVIKTDRQGVLLVFRGDAEKSMSDEDRNCIIKELNLNGLSYKTTDMHSDCPVNKNNRMECVRKKMQEFADSKLVITDRLHGMIFAALTGTPCIVFSNYNHKVKGTYNWIEYLPYIKYVENVNDVKALIPSLINMKDCRYDNSPLLPHFNKLSEVVKQHVN